MNQRTVAKGRLEIHESVDGDAALLRLSGAMDETFTGFDPTHASQVVIELGGLSRITSYGVRQWIRSRDQLAVKNLYYLNCPPFFIDQLNMVLNFGGHGQVITAFAPFSCSKCKSEQWALIDVLKRHAELAAGKVPDEPCPTCNSKMEMDELPETYFGFVKTAGARGLSPAVAPLLSSAQLYVGAPTSSVAEPGPVGERAQVQKLVHDRVTYFRISGLLDKRFRARSLLEGTEGEVALDVAELVVADEGREEWDRLRLGLAQRASVVTLVDLPPSFLDAVQTNKLSLAGTVVYSTLQPHHCEGCGRDSNESVVLAGGSQERVCSSCGSMMRYVGKPEQLQLAARLSSGPILSGTREMIERREDLLSRARIEAEAPPEIRRPGSILGKYEIVRALSVGGMAEVFLAVQKGIGGFEKPVALKRIRKTVLERRHFAVEQFLNEAKIAATLTHPNIAQIYDVGEDEGLLYLAMEYVHGKDLRVFLRRLRERGEKVPLGAALHIAEQIARALHHAYTTADLNGRQLKAIHRDISPHNVLVSFDGAIKLVDFGVAISASTGQEPGQIAGKHNYMSPEQLQGQPLDARSDLFSLGVVLYEMLTFERPFQHDTREETLAAVNEARYQAASELRPDLPKSIDKLLGKLLSKKPSDRFPDGSRVADELLAFAAQTQAVGGAEWIRSLIPVVFPSSSTETDDSAFQPTATPHSDSFSLEPTNNRLTMEEPTPSARQQPLRLAGGVDPASFDEHTVSQLISPQRNQRLRMYMIAALVLMAALLAILWWRY
jgi:eukaryotic-like serine/threonine-protein kinase